jgi:hypothetical protein
MFVSLMFVSTISWWSAKFPPLPLLSCAYIAAVHVFITSTQYGGVSSWIKSNNSFCLDLSRDGVRRRFNKLIVGCDRAAIGGVIIVPSWDRQDMKITPVSWWVYSIFGIKKFRGTYEIGLLRNLHPIDMILIRLAIFYDREHFDRQMKAFAFEFFLWLTLFWFG